MTKLVGYSENRSKTPFQIGVIVFFVLLVLFFLWLISIDPARQKEKPTTTTTSTTSTTSTTLAAAVTTTSQAASTTTTIIPANSVSAIKIISQSFSRDLANNQPVDIADEFLPDQIVYCHTVVEVDNPPVVIAHVWQNPQGETVFSIDLNIYRKPGRTWSRMTIPPAGTGKWSVKVMAAGKEIAAKTFTVVEQKE